jgi:hypothetical protein
MRLSRRPSCPVEVASGEKVLAWATASEGGVDDAVGGTAAAIYLPGGVRVPWEQVEAADWDLETETLRVTEVGTWGTPRPVHAFVLADPARLLQLVRERVTASVVLQRHVAIRGPRGVRVIARRAPTGARGLSWFFEYDDGIDPADPFVDHAAQEALAAARNEVGDR